MSGPAAYLGQNAQNSAKIEIDRINKAGGLLGAQLELVVRDTELKPDKTVQVVRELTSAGSPVDYLIGPGITGMFQAARSIIEDARIPNCLSLVSGAGVLTAQNAPVSFRTLDPDALRLESTVAYLSSTGTKRFGMVYENDATGQGIAAAMPDLAKKYGVEWVGVEYSNASDPTNVNQVRALLAKNIDTVLVSNVMPGSAATALAVERLGALGKVRIFGWSGLRGVAYVEGAYPHSIGTIVQGPYTSAQTDIPESQWLPAYREHVKAVVQQFGVDTGAKTGATAWRGAAEAAECMDIFERAVKKAGSVDKAQVVAAIETLDIPESEAPVGVRVRFSKQSHEVYSGDQFYFYEWRAGPSGKAFLKQVASPADIAKLIKK